MGRWFLCLLFGLLGGGLAACAAPPALPTPLPCDDAGQTAVALTLLDENDAPLERVQISYRVNGGDWLDLPERVNGRAHIPGSGGGYEIRAAKPGYQTGETAVIVPAPLGETCDITTQAVILQLAPAVCPVSPAPLTVRVMAPVGVEDLALTAISPVEGRQTLACQAGENGCQTFQWPLGRPGGYQLVFDGLPAYDGVTVDNGLIHYRWTPYEVELRHGQQTRTLTGAGANRLNLEFPVTADEVGCPQPDLRALTAVASPDLTTGEPYPPLDVAQEGGLTMTDLGAPDCQRTPVLTPVAFTVTVPDGTPLADVGLRYWLDGDWQAGECGVSDGRLRCTAQYPNPLLAQPYAVKAVVAGQEYVHTQIPFDTLCILFR